MSKHTWAVVDQNNNVCYLHESTLEECCDYALVLKSEIPVSIVQSDWVDECDDRFKPAEQVYWLNDQLIVVTVVNDWNVQLKACRVRLLEACTVSPYLYIKPCETSTDHVLFDVKNKEFVEEPVSIISIE